MNSNVLDELLHSAAAQSHPLPLGEAERVLHEHFGICAEAERLTGEVHENFRMRTAAGAEFVLKVPRADEPPQVSDLCVSTLLYLERARPELPVPRIQRAPTGEAWIEFRDQRGAARRAFVCTYLAGMPLLESTTRTVQQHHACARLSAQVGQALRGFDHPAARRAVIWDLKRFPELSNLVRGMDDWPERAFLLDFLEEFSCSVAPRLTAVRHQFVHNDFNARNILVDPGDHSQVLGLIDFGDAVHTALVADVAVAVTGQLSNADAADLAIREFVHSYCEVEPLGQEELALLNVLIAARILQNFIVTSWYRQHCAAGHFAAFDREFFKWRLELARQLTSGSGDSW